MKYYISCAEANHGRVKRIDEVLSARGHACVYAWWSADCDRQDGFEPSFSRVQAVEESELFLCLLPATRNSAIEFGTALASRYGKRIILWSDTGADFEPPYANTYYMHPSVTRMTCSFDDLIEYLKTL